METKNNLKPLFFHGETIDGCKFTVAGRIEDEDLLLGIGICSDKDQFCKAKGRAIATGRMNHRRHAPGYFITSVYALTNSFCNSTGSFTSDYYIGNEVKVFVELCLKYNKFTRNQLLDYFRLKNRTR